jgi:hypothetical protein
MLLPAALGGPQRPCYSWFLPSRCQHIPYKHKLKICVKFSSSHMKTGKCNCSERTDVTNRRTISLPISMCIRWWNSCRPHNPCDGYNKPQSVVPFMTEISFCWCFHPLYCHQVMLAPYLNVTPFQFQFLGPYVLWHAFPIWSSSPSTANFLFIMS